MTFADQAAMSGHEGTLPATSGKPAKNAEAGDLARLRAESRKLKSRNDRLESELGKTKTALDIAGKAFALRATRGRIRHGALCSWRIRALTAVHDNPKT
jgi:hypothetical protein